MYCSPERAATTKRTAATENHERFTYTLPSETEVELRYECRHDDGDTEMHEIYERLDTMSPLLPPVEDYIEDYKVFGASTNLTTLQPGPRNISSSVQCRTPHCN